MTNIYIMMNTRRKVGKQLTGSKTIASCDWLLFLITITLQESWEKLDVLGVENLYTTI